MDNIKKFSKSKMTLSIIITVLVVVIGVICSLARFITDIIWFSDLGYLGVYFKELVTKIKLGVPGFIVVGILCFLLLKLIAKNFYKKNVTYSSRISSKKQNLLFAALSAVFGLMFAGNLLGSAWFQILEFFNSTDFNIADPLFGKDVSFYVFKLEFLETLSHLMITLFGALIIITVIAYVILIVSSEGVQAFSSVEEAQAASGVQIDLSQLKEKGKMALSIASWELCLLGVLFLLSIGVNFYLKQFDMLYGGTGVCYGAGYADVKVTLPVYKIMMVLSVVSAVLLVIAFKKRNWKLGACGPALMILVLLLGTGIASAVQAFVVSPDELDKESEYLQNNINYTRLAYDLADIRVEDFSASGDISKKDVLNNMETFSNIRINDFEPAEMFYNQTQSIRSYYNFNDVDVDRYYVNGEYTQVFLSAREIDQSRIEDNWLIKHLKYTHGYGLTLSRVDKITSSGQPAMLIDSIPPVSDIPEISIERPEIYYGESTNDYIITNTDEDEFDYPAGESNVYCDYQGKGGIPLSFFNRVLFTVREGSIKILISDNINSNSRIHIYRNIMQRINMIAPFLEYDADPCLIAADGQLYWMLSGYTSSEYYPYSEPYSKDRETNYIRNSVKVVVNAYDGTTDFYMVDDSDPIAVTLSKIYPELLKPMSEMPESLKAHVLYPGKIFNIQANIYQKYHMTDVAVFYQNEDPWAISQEFYGQSTVQMTPNYFIMKLPGEESAEFVSTIPYTPSNKSNMTGILMARNDGEHYGEIVLYRMPKDRIIYGPAQIEAQINQDPEISKELTLWNNSGSSYSRGNMFAIPVEDSIIYVEPIYLESSSASLPEVKRVVMYYGEKLAYEPTLAECLDVLFGDGAGDPLLTEFPIESGKQAALELDDSPAAPAAPQTPSKPQTPAAPQLSDIAAAAQEAYEKALAAMQSADWKGFGKYMDELSKYINQMAEK